MARPAELPTVDDIAAAALRIAPYILRTPVLHTPELDARAGCSLLFKCENLQLGGAFKLRGATNAVRSLDEASARAGVATHSSGNHGAALARAARAPSRAQILRGNTSSAGRPIWNGRIESGRKLGV